MALAFTKVKEVSNYMIKTIFWGLRRGLVSAFALRANLLRRVYMFTVSALTESTSSVSIFTA